MGRRYCHNGYTAFCTLPLYCMDSEKHTWRCINLLLLVIHLDSHTLLTDYYLENVTSAMSLF